MIRKLFISLSVLFGLLVITIGIAWYLLNDESFLKGQLHKYVLETTGRSLTINGSLNLDLGREITIEASEIRFSNAEWRDEPNMAKVGQLKLTLNSGVLFGEKLILHNIEFADCDVDMATNDEGVSNWSVFRSSDKTSEPEEPGLKEPAFRLDRARIDNCNILHSTPKREKPLKIEITKLNMELQDDGKYLKSITGVVDGVSLEVTGTLGPIRALWQGGRFDHDINLQAGDIKLDSSGTVADTKTISGADISMSFSGPDIGDVIKDFALPPFSTGAFDFSLDFNTTGAMTQVNIDGDLGSLEAKVKGQLDRLLHPSAGDLSLTASGPDLGALAEALGVEGLVHDPFNVELVSSVSDGRTELDPLIFNTELDRVEINGTIGAYPEFADTHLKIAVHSDDADRWTSPFGLDFGPFGKADSIIDFSTDATGITRVEATLTQSDSQLTATGSLGHFPELDQPDFLIKLATPDFRKLGQQFRFQHLPAAPFKFSGQIKQDQSRLQLDDIQADLDGNLFKVSGEVFLTENFAGSRLNVDADISSAEKLATMFGVDDVPDQRLTLKSVIQPVGKGLDFKVSDGQLGDMKIEVDGEIPDLSAPALLNSDFDVDLPSLTLLNFLVPETSLPDLPFSASGNIRHGDGLVQLNSARLTLGSTQIEAGARMEPGKDLVGSSLTVSARGTDIRELVDLAHLESLPHDFSLSGKWARTADGDQLEDIVIRLGETDLKLGGRADNLLNLGDFSIQAQLSMADVSVLNSLLDQSFDPATLSLSTSLEGNPQAFDIKGLSLQAGKSDLTANIRVDRSAKLKFSGEIDSTHIDLRPFQKEITEEAVTPADDPKEPGSAQSAAASSKKMFDDTPVKTIQESPVDLDLKIRIEKAEFGYTKLRNIDLNVLWEDHFFQLKPFEIRDSQGSDFTGSLTFDGRQGTPDLDIKFHGKDVRLGLSAVKGQDPATYPPVEMNINLHGAGHTRHEIAKSLDGTIRVFWGSGLYATTGLSFIFSDFITELLSTLNPFAKTSEYSKLECGVVAADVQSGMMLFEPILIQDEKITIISKGTINLDTEVIDLEFNTKSRKGFGVSAGVIINPFIKVGGSLTEPAIAFDAGSAVISGGTAVATVGISLLAKSFADRFLSSKDPCGDARKKLAERDAPPQP